MRLECRHACQESLYFYWLPRARACKAMMLPGAARNRGIEIGCILHTKKEVNDASSAWRCGIRFHMLSHLNLLTTFYHHYCDHLPERTSYTMAKLSSESLKVNHRSLPYKSPPALLNISSRQPYGHLPAQRQYSASAALLSDGKTEGASMVMTSLISSHYSRTFRLQSLSIRSLWKRTKSWLL